MGPRAGLDRRKISSPSGFDPGPPSPKSVAVPTELPGPHTENIEGINHLKTSVKLHNVILYANPPSGNRDVGCEQTHMMKPSAAFPNFAKAPKYLLMPHTLIIQREFLTPNHKAPSRQITLPFLRPQHI